MVITPSNFYAYFPIVSMVRVSTASHPNYSRMPSVEERERTVTWKPKTFLANWTVR